jgi:hypothetical protein
MGGLPCKAVEFATRIKLSRERHFRKGKDTAYEPMFTMRCVIKPVIVSSYVHREMAGSIGYQWRAYAYRNLGKNNEANADEQKANKLRKKE